MLRVDSPPLHICVCVWTCVWPVIILSLGFFGQHEQLSPSPSGNLLPPLDSDTLQQLILLACPRRRGGEDGLCDVDGR